MTQRSLTRTMFALLALLAPHAAVHADAAADAKISIQHQYDKRDAALAHFDIEGYLAVYNTNYLNMSAGQARPDRQRDRLIARYQRADKISRQETVQSVTMTPDGATVIIGSVTHLYGRNPTTKQPFADVTRETDRAFWVSTKRGWRMKQERKISDVMPRAANVPGTVVSDAGNIRITAPPMINAKPAKMAPSPKTPPVSR